MLHQIFEFVIIIVNVLISILLLWKELIVCTDLQTLKETVDSQKEDIKYISKMLTNIDNFGCKSQK